jgi:hypothetical protein
MRAYRFAAPSALCQDHAARAQGRVTLGLEVLPTLCTHSTDRASGLD